MTDLERRFSIIYSVILTLHLCIELWLDNHWVYFVSKPSIVLSLICYGVYVLNQNKINIKWLIIALVFSLCGDILLMFVPYHTLFFILGLLAFLIAHVFYGFLFLKQRDKSKTIWLPLAIIGLYGFLLFSSIKNGLGTLMVPVIIYMSVIIFMAVSAYLRPLTLKNKSFILVLLGAVFFLISDSLLALNKFYDPFKYAGFCIMLTYGLAQYFITIGILRTKV